MHSRFYILVSLFGILFFQQNTYAQVDFNKTPDDDLGNVEDKFQEYFFEALKQKGIENYDRSIKAFLKCIELDDSKSVVYFELGKNYIKLKNFGAAETALKKAITKDPENEWYLDELWYLNETDKEILAALMREKVTVHNSQRMRVRKNFPMSEIAHDLGITPGVARSRACRMRDKVEEGLFPFDLLGT